MLLLYEEVDVDVHVYVDADVDVNVNVAVGVDADADVDVDGYGYVQGYVYNVYVLYSVGKASRNLVPKTKALRSESSTNLYPKQEPYGVNARDENPEHLDHLVRSVAQATADATAAVLRR